MLRRQFLKFSGVLGAGIAVSDAGWNLALAQRTSAELIILGG
jgi:hypothetical protein